ncbi:MAG: hypothetical protein M0C28_05265 [Candidatus Moduliflexus flocculans]|nr:hypothetical protein [Candidatus Moduliflexus flocculans]
MPASGTPPPDPVPHPTESSGVGDYRSRRKVRDRSRRTYADDPAHARHSALGIDAL